MVASSAVLAASDDLLAVIAARVTLALSVAVAGIHVTRLLHDAVPSSVRSGVASGVGALSWIAFLPVALVVGLLADRHGVPTAGWTFTALVLVAGALLVRLSLRRPAVDGAPVPLSGEMWGHNSAACATIQT